jgi:hypothetical protein
VTLTVTADWDGRCRRREGQHPEVGEGPTWGGGEQAGVAAEVNWGGAEWGGRWRRRESQQPAAGDVVLAPAENKRLQGQSQKTHMNHY